MHKIFIIHFQPLEQYPPVMNLLRYLVKENAGKTIIHAVSTIPAEKALFQIEGIAIHRPAGWTKPLGTFKRGWLYLAFNLGALWLLIKNRPSKVLYYETMSAFPAVLYKKLFNRMAELMVHYHEYTSPKEYQSGGLMNRWFHQLELSVMPSMRWLSHTNQDRLNLFLKDIGNNPPQQVAVLENLPPASWATTGRQKDNLRRESISFVYVGAFSLETMYLKEWAGFVKQNPQKYKWDIYSDNYESQAVEWIRQLNASNIQFRGGVTYDELPGVLSLYDAGLILYKGHIPNYVYNAPNKLFEYLACGLDVLFPSSMNGCLMYARDQFYPKVVAVDYTNLSEKIIDTAVDRSGLQRKESTYFYEANLSPLSNALLNA